WRACSADFRRLSLRYALGAGRTARPPRHLTLLPHRARERARAGEPPEEKAVPETVRMQIGKQDLDLEVVEGTEEEKGVDISNLRAKTGTVTLDPAFMNTASTTSAITFLDGERGILRYRGIPIEEMGERSTFVETAYLLIYGHLPSRDELARWQHLLT